MDKAMLTVLALGAGFLVGFLWGQGTRSAIGANTSTELSGGVLTVRTDLRAAAREGLSSIL